MNTVELKMYGPCCSSPLSSVSDYYHGRWQFSVVFAEIQSMRMDRAEIGIYKTTLLFTRQSACNPICLYVKYIWPRQFHLFTYVYQDNYAVSVYD